MVVIRESLWESNVWRVGQVLPLQDVYQFEVAATLLVMSGSLSIAVIS
jgi:hypothetical protein